MNDAGSSANVAVDGALTEAQVPAGVTPYVSKAPDASVSDEVIRTITDRWLRNLVIGLNLCPFAKSPYTKGQVQIRVSRADNAEALLGDLSTALLSLSEKSEDEVETMVLVHPWALHDFLDYNDFLDVADACLQALDLEGVIQVASFHPDYQFADARADEVSNATNQSPFPMLHLIRESSLDRAVDSGADADSIVERNIGLMNEMGWDGVQQLRRKA